MGIAGVWTSRLQEGGLCVAPQQPTTAAAAAAACRRFACLQHYRCRRRGSGPPAGADGLREALHRAGGVTL